MLTTVEITEMRRIAATLALEKLHVEATILTRIADRASEEHSAPRSEPQQAAIIRRGAWSELPRTAGDIDTLLSGVRDWLTRCKPGTAVDITLEEIEISA